MWRIRLNVNDLQMEVSLAVEAETDPTTWASTMASPNCGWWLLATYQEMCQLAQMDTFVFTDTPPPDRKALATKWVWKTKRSPDSKIDRFKARWVARGDLQKKGINYGEPFAPVAMLISIRVLLTLVAVLDLELDQLDVVGAFLNGGLESEVYLPQPIGFTLVGNTRICALQKSLYGLCQAARAWYHVLHNELHSLGCRRLVTDMSVWRSPEHYHPESLQFIAAHIDDILCGSSRATINHTQAHLRSKFEIRDMGPASVFIGLKIIRDRERRLIYIDQSHYGRDILDLYGMAECNPCLVPMASADQNLGKALDGECLNDAEKKHYQAILGSLGYLMNCSRPDLAFPVNKLSQFVSSPAERHLLALKRVLRYLRGTTNTRMILGAPTSSEATSDLLVIEVRGWFDASWADNEYSRSTFGYAIVYGYTAFM